MILIRPKDYYKIVPSFRSLWWRLRYNLKENMFLANISFVRTLHLLILQLHWRVGSGSGPWLSGFVQNRSGSDHICETLRIAICPHMSVSFNNKLLEKCFLPEWSMLTIRKNLPLGCQLTINLTLSSFHVTSSTVRKNQQQK